MISIGFKVLSAVLIWVLILAVTAAQNNQEPARSPFSSPDTKDPGSSRTNAPRTATSARNQGNPGNRNTGTDVVLKKSPFTPPPDGASRQDKNYRPKNSVKTRPRAQEAQVPKVQTPSGSDATSAATKRPSTIAVKGTSAPKPVGSPFRPPVQTEFREGQAPKPPSRTVQEPASTPDRARNGGNSGRSQKRVKGQRSPRVTVYQERDIHDTPGVTPWTRYTPRPKVRSREGPSEPRTGRCGGLSYSPRSQICCQGRIQRRQGMKPSCCGRQSFDTAFSKCCNEVISLRTSQHPDCL